MKWIGICFVWIVWVHTALSQTYELIPIIQKKDFYLDSRGSKLFTGTNTAVIELDLPVNTVKWYYRFYNIHQKSLLSKYAPALSFSDEWKHTQFLQSSPKIPNIPSSIRNGVSVYLLEDSSQIQPLENQLLIEKVSYQEDLSIVNMPTGWMEVSHPKYISGLQYLGLLNHGNLTGTNVVLDVIAVCKKRSISGSDWNETQLKQLEEEIMDIVEAEQVLILKEQVMDCLLTKVQQKFSFYNDVQKFLFSNIQFLKDQIQYCIQGISTEIIDTSKVLDPYQIVGEWKTEKGEVMHFMISQKVSIQKKTGETLQGIWYIHDQSLIVEFENFKPQKYQPIIVSPDKFVWKNRLTGNYLRYQKLIKP